MCSFNKLFFILVFSLCSVCEASETHSLANDLEAMKELLDLPPPDVANANTKKCINGTGLKSALQITKNILEHATYHPEEDGYLVFDVPEGFITDTGAKVNLKNEVAIYQKDKKEAELVYMVERNDALDVRVISYVTLNNESKCVETKYNIPLDEKSKPSVSK